MKSQCPNLIRSCCWCFLQGNKQGSNSLCTTICDLGQSHSRTIFTWIFSLTIDLHWLLPKFILTFDLIPFIFALFAFTVELYLCIFRFTQPNNKYCLHYFISVAFDCLPKNVWKLFFTLKLPCALTFHLTMVADCSTEGIGVTPLCQVPTLPKPPSWHNVSHVSGHSQRSTASGWCCHPWVREIMRWGCITLRLVHLSSHLKGWKILRFQGRLPHLSPPSGLGGDNIYTKWIFFQQLDLLFCGYLSGSHPTKSL